MSAHTRFRISLTADFFDEVGNPKIANLSFDLLEACDHIVLDRFVEHRPVIGSDQIRDNHGLIVLTPRVERDSLADSEDLLAIGRFGVGYDNVDVDACTDADVLVTITAGAVDRSVAEATVGWMLALTHQMLAKDQLVRTGHWDDRTNLMGCELRDRRLGVIGLGGIGRSVVRLLEGFGMSQPIAYDPAVSAQTMADIGVCPVGLDELLSTADFVSIHCPLNEQTCGLIGQRELAMMKSNAYLLNTARGGIVDENALYEALKERQIAGAALDCFADEPLSEPHRFGELDNVILAPHSIAWTHEMFRDVACAACQNMLHLSLGQRPQGVLNPVLFERGSFRAKWQRIIGMDVT